MTRHHLRRLALLVLPFLLFAASRSPLAAEGIASMTEVTRENATRLPHHRLDVIRRSQRGKSYIALEIRPEEAHPFTGCRVTIRDPDGDKILLQFEPDIGQAPRRDGLGKGSRVYFHVADEWIDGVEVRYHLNAGGPRSHVFTIEKGTLARIANLR